MKRVGQIPPVLLYCLISMSTLTETIYSAALPDIAEKLHTDGGIAQFSTSVYYIGYAIGIFTLGRISDIYGRRPVVLGGIAFYIISTFFISLSESIEFFITMRFFQAYGASVGSVVAQSMTRDSYRGHELSYIYASVSTLMAVVPTVGSMIGGYIMDYSNEWKNVFRFLTLFSGGLFLIYIKFLPETNAYTGSARDHRFMDIVKVAIKDKTLMSYGFIVGAFNGICYGFFIQAPFIFIENLSMNPSDYGKLFFIITFANLFGGLLCRYLVRHYFNIYKIQKSGFMLSILGGILFLASSSLNIQEVDVNFVALSIFVPMAIHMMGHSLVVPMLLRNALENYRKVNGAAGAVFGSIYTMMSAVSSFIVSIFHSDTINTYAYLFAGLMLISIVLFYKSMQWKEKQKRNIFSEHETDIPLVDDGV